MLRTLKPQWRWEVSGSWPRRINSVLVWHIPIGDERPKSQVWRHATGHQRLSSAPVRASCAGADCGNRSRGSAAWLALPHPGLRVVTGPTEYHCWTTSWQPSRTRLLREAGGSATAGACMELGSDAVSIGDKTMDCGASEVYEPLNQYKPVARAAKYSKRRISKRPANGIFLDPAANCSFWRKVRALLPHDPRRSGNHFPVQRGVNCARSPIPICCSRPATRFAIISKPSLPKS
jgi:hypothetical protein